MKLDNRSSRLVPSSASEASHQSSPHTPCEELLQNKPRHRRSRKECGHSCPPHPQRGPAANALLCAINQAAYILKRQIESQAKDFKEHGGFTERLHAARVQARVEQTGTPLCPLCGQPMRRRTAGKTNRQFWGCPAYPSCKGTQDIET